jgi:hypothetical protein
VVLDQLLLEVLVAAKVREEQLVLRVQRHALAKDAKVELVGRLDEAFVAAPASGHRDKDMGRRHRFIQLDDRKHLPALRDVDRGRQAPAGTSGIWKRFTAWSSLPATCLMTFTG